MQFCRKNDESGRERAELLRTPADRRYALYHAVQRREGLPTIVSTCIAINCVVGSGFLSLPKLFAVAGLFPSCILILFVTGIMTLTTSWEAESMVRAEALSTSQLERAAPFTLFSQGQAMELGGRSIKPKREIISNRSFEMTEMCRLFGGRSLYILCALVIILYLGSTLTAYAFVFAESLSTELPAFGFKEVCTPDKECPLYKAYCILFACLATPLSLLDPSEQATFQVAMSLLRFLVAFVMMSSSLYEFLYGPGLLFDTLDNSINSIPTSPKKDTLAGLALLLPAIVFALNINGSVPLVAKSMRHKDQVDLAIRGGLWVSALMYIGIGSSVALAFGTSVAKSANVAWERFTTRNILSSEQDNNFFAPVLQGLATLVVLFPAADVLSIYPLTAIVIANNLLAVCFGEKADKFQHSRLVSRFFRLLVSLPPVLCACLVPNFSKIIDASGTLAVLISCVFPPLLSILGKRASRTELENSSLDITKFTLDRGYFWPKIFVFCFAGLITVLLFLTPHLLAAASSQQ